MDKTESMNDNIIMFPGARVDLEIKANTSIQQKSADKDGLTDLEWQELQAENFTFSTSQDKERDLAYEIAFKKDPSFDVANMYHRPRLGQDFSLPSEIQQTLKKLEHQFNQWDYLIRKIAYYSR